MLPFSKGFEQRYGQTRTIFRYLAASHNLLPLFPCALFFALGSPPIAAFHCSSRACFSLRLLLFHSFSHTSSCFFHLTISLSIHVAVSSAVRSHASMAMRCPTPSIVTPFTLPSALPPLPPTPMPVAATFASLLLGPLTSDNSPKMYRTDGRSSGNLANVRGASER